MKKAQAQGYMFEVLIGRLLSSAGYSWSTFSKKIHGRGAEHQIDAIGITTNVSPFVNNIRLLAEAKYQKRPIGLPVVRNMVGVLKDINESYIPSKKSIAEKILGSRHTNCAVIFSNKNFTDDAIDYGYAHNIYLISYQGNPLMREAIEKFENLCSLLDFQKLPNKVSELKDMFKLMFKEASTVIMPPRLRKTDDFVKFKKTIKRLDNLVTRTGSIFGFVEGSYPIHIISEDRNIKTLLFSSARENGVLPVGYRFEVVRDNILFSFKVGDSEAKFIIPKYIFKNFLDKGKMILAKKSLLNNVLIPDLKNDGVGKIVRLKFNQDLINTTNH